jgi:hypothetical protein
LIMANTFLMDIGENMKDKKFIVLKLVFVTIIFFAGIFIAESLH